MQEKGWKLNRNHYYQEGWLSTANLRGVVGVTYTTSHCGGSGFLEPSCEKYLNLEPPNRTNYNLRGHSQKIVRTNLDLDGRKSFFSKRLIEKLNS